MRILGIDCGSGATGYGVVDSDGARHRLVEAGTVTTSARLPFERRLALIAKGLRELIARQAPDAAAVEEVFHGVNPRSAFLLAQVRGAVLLVLAEAGLPVASYSPLEVKASVTGYGKAEKSQVQYMLPRLLEASVPASPDACDALAVAICHAHHRSAAALRSRL